MINSQPRQLPIVNEKGNMLDLFYQWFLGVTNLQTIVGTGSPEGVVEAAVPRFYLQTDGAAHSILWVKVLSDIGGDRSMGWQLV